MIYLITNTPEKFQDTVLYSLVSMKSLIDYLDTQVETFLDAETRGFDPYTKKLLSLQIGDYDNQFIVDCESVDIKILKPYLERLLIVGQNLKFDLKFLYHKGIYPRKIYDTFVAEKIINCGIKFIKAGLDSLVERYAGVILDKSIRVDIPKEGLTSRVIKYAVDDIKYLGKVRDGQVVKIKDQDLGGVVNLENRFTPCLAYIEYCGFKLDVDKWKKKMEQDLILTQGLRKKLDDYILSGTNKQFVQSQLDMFQDQKCSINWDSPKQVLEFFESLGLDCTIKVKGKIKKSIEASVIGKYQDKEPIVKIYIEYKQAEKVVTTYGQSFITQVNPVTKRIHTNFSQILDTGRISSGGKDKDLNINLCNFQNIPSDSETRSCFIAEEGNTLIISDYSGQENIVLANSALDPVLLDFYDNGLGDMHSFTASKMYPELEGLTLDEIKKNHKEKRQFAKSCSFAIAYGGEGSTLSANLGITKEEGDKIYNAYFTAFPGLKIYFEKVKKEGLALGYILIDSITKRKSYLPFFNKYQELNKQIDQKFWTRYRELKQYGGPEFDEMRLIVKDYFYFKGVIERKSLNYPIQGQSASITKISCVYIFNYIIENNLFGIVKFVNTIHDENVVESPIKIVDKISKVVGDSMCKAADLFCKRVPLKAVPDINLFWRK